MCVSGGGGGGGELPSFNGWHPYPSDACYFYNILKFFSEFYTCIVVIFPDTSFISFYQLTLANLRDL